MSNKLEALAPNLIAGLRQLGLPTQDTLIQALLHYLELLYHWNQRINLTAVPSPEAAIAKHLLDSLAIGPHLSGDQLLDVGTGAGLPGIPLALLYPHKKVTLVDSVGKKVHFLKHVARELTLDNVTPIESRVEKLLPPPNAAYSDILSRAFSNLDNFLDKTQHLADAKTHFLAMKGQYPSTEITALPTGFTIENTIQLIIPGLDEQRCLIDIRCELRQNHD